jgi:ankyrin repeat protein
MVRFLLSQGADVTAGAAYGCTPLHATAHRDNVEIGRILLEHGADPSLECNGRRVPEAFLGLSRQGGAGQG